jgi:hypothetical protein
MKIIKNIDNLAAAELAGLVIVGLTSDECNILAQACSNTTWRQQATCATDSAFAFRAEQKAKVSDQLCQILGYGVLHHLKNKEKPSDIMGEIQRKITPCTIQIP